MLSQNRLVGCLIGGVAVVRILISINNINSISKKQKTVLMQVSTQISSSNARIGSLIPINLVSDWYVFNNKN